MSIIESLISTSSGGRQMQGMTPVYRPALNGEDLDISVSNLQVMTSEFQHDIAIIEATSNTLTETASMAGSAISFIWGVPPRTELFTGYVDTVSDNKSESGAGLLTFQMMCFGATKEMQTGSPRVWEKITIPKVVENLAYRGLLGFHGHDHPLQWPLITQTDESDWKLVCDLAKRLGWSVFSSYGVVRMYDPLRLFQQSGPYISLVSSSFASTAYADYERALVEFMPIEESDNSYRQIGRKISFFDGLTVQTVTQEGEKYTTFKHLTNVIARNREEADIYANVTSLMASNWGQQASARVLGNANITPGMCVDIYTDDPRYYKGRYNGRWLVRAVQHQSNRQTFQTNLTLCRPSSAFGTPMYPYVPFWNQPSERGVKARPVMTLVSNKWISSWADRSAREML